MSEDVPGSPLSAVSPAAAAAPGGAIGEETFSGKLWDQVERVYQRLTNGRHDLKRLKQYMEARAEMSRSLSKSLVKASTQPELEDSSSISAVWRDIKETGLAQAKSQDGFAVVCTEIAAALEAQIQEVKKQKTMLHDKWTKLLADVAKKTQAHDKAQKQYAEAVKQAETAVMNRDAAHEQKLPDKVAQKAETRAKQTLKEVDTLHAAYQKSVQILQEAQGLQDSTCMDLLQQFEKLERTRLRIFLDQLDRWANQHDTLRVQLEQVATSLHANVAAVNMDADLQQFIKENTTGKTPPPHVEYVPCKSQILDHAGDLKPAGSTLSLPGHQSSSSGSFAGGIAAAPASPAAASTPVAAAAAASAPAPTPVAAAVKGTGETAEALYDFEQNEPDDLAFKVGQTIKLLTCAESEDWWQGELNGKVGIFPKSYVKKNGPGGAPVNAGAEGQPAAPISSSPSGGAPVAPAGGDAFGGGADGFGNKAAEAPTPAAHGVDANGAAEVPKQLDAECAALFDFDGQDEDELSFKAGQLLVITGELNGWYLGKLKSDPNQKVGIFPSNFVQMQQ